MINIAVLITCFNRREKTLECLKDIYGQEKSDNITLDIYIVDGGSSDETPENICKNYPNVHLSIHSGLYWAGGMRAAWKEAAQQKKYDFYWLLNDDTHLYTECLKELLKADEYALATFGKQGIYVGSTRDLLTKQFSYGGRKLEKWGNSIAHNVIPDQKNYQLCDLGNANIMLVSKEVYNAIGGFCELYTHGIADYDYTLRAVKAKFPVIVAPEYCGECIDDHGNNWSSQSIPLKKRIEYLYSPKGLAYREYLFYIKEFFPKQYHIAKFKLWLKTLCPSLWDSLK